jgi:hypothetical protein
MAPLKIPVPEAPAELFSFINDILAVPSRDLPLPAATKYNRPTINMRWQVPCPSLRALADFPDPTGGRKQWLDNWTSCNELRGPLQPAAPLVEPVTAPQKKDLKSKEGN